MNFSITINSLVQAQVEIMTYIAVAFARPGEVLSHLRELTRSQSGAQVR